MNQKSSLVFAVDRTIKIPLYQQLCEEIRAQANSGVLKQGALMPATRALAESLTVSRSTVVTAYEQLVAEGYLEARQGANYTLCTTGSIELTHTERLESETNLETQSAPNPLTPSRPDMRLFPYRHWAKAVARVCRTNPEAMLTGSTSFGNFTLRQAIANHVREWRGFDASPHQIIITAGATDALNICFRTLVESSQTVGIENPGYQPILSFIKSQGLTPHFLDIDNEGAMLPKKVSINSPKNIAKKETEKEPKKEVRNESEPHLVILTPSHQYPLGGVMSPQRRKDYINWANKHDSWIIEDDYDSEFRYSGRPIPAMASFDNLDRTLYIGSFSKVFSNSLRLGYIIAPYALIDSIKQTMDTFGLKAGLMPQQALADFMHSGEFYRHIRRVRNVYNERRKCLIQMLSQRFSHLGYVQDHPAGMQLVFHLNKTISDVEVAKQACAKGFNFEALSKSSMQGNQYNGFILGFCGYSEKEMRDALDCLSRVFETQITTLKTEINRNKID